MKNIIITGIPRSGTTLTCHLLNQLSDTIALHEPMKIVAKHETCYDHDLLRNRVDNFFEETRQSLLKDGIAITKHKDGKVPANSRGNYRGIAKYLPNWMLGKRMFGRSISRHSTVKKSRINFDKPLSESFNLCVKHNGGFTAILQVLQQHYPCYAIIRNPLAILASWNSLKINLYDGHMHTVERIDPILKLDLSKLSNRFDRQFHILNWFFEKLQQQLPALQIIRYENLVLSGGRALDVITPHARTLNESLANKNYNQLYNQRLMMKLGKALLDRGGAYTYFYKKQDVEDLLTYISHKRN